MSPDSSFKSLLLFSFLSLEGHPSLLLIKQEIGV
jgi:hypothetical protein